MLVIVITESFDYKHVFLDTDVNGKAISSRSITALTDASLNNPENDINDNSSSSYSQSTSSIYNQINGANFSRATDAAGNFPYQRTDSGLYFWRLYKHCVPCQTLVNATHYSSQLHIIVIYF